jgi:uncharacterized membrane protein YhdT
MNKTLKIMLWIFGLILTFVLDYVIAITTGFIGHAAWLEMGYIFLWMYVSYKNEENDHAE